MGAISLTTPIPPRPRNSWRPTKPAHIAPAYFNLFRRQRASASSPKIRGSGEGVQTHCKPLPGRMTRDIACPEQFPDHVLKGLFLGIRCPKTMIRKTKQFGRNARIATPKDIINMIGDGARRPTTLRKIEYARRYLELQARPSQRIRGAQRKSPQGPKKCHRCAIRAICRRTQFPNTVSSLGVPSYRSVKKFLGSRAASLRTGILIARAPHVPLFKAPRKMA